MPRPKRSIISNEDVETKVNPHVVNAAAKMAPPEIVPQFHASEIEVIDSRKGLTKAQIAILAKEEIFMNEKVTVFVEMDEEPNSPIYIPSGHNGSTQYIQRGTEQVIKRKYLYSLLMGKKVAVNCNFGRKEGGGEVNDLKLSAKGFYRVSLVADANQERGGMRWVQSVVAQPA